jgi:dehydrogenase/reductase SDR family member 12
MNNATNQHPAQKRELAWTSLLDAALDRSIVLGYGNVGLAIRRRLPSWPKDPPRMDAKVVLVTGAASGIGLAAAKGFAKLGASVQALGRDESRAGEARAQILADVPGADVTGVACDVSSLQSLRSLAGRLRSEGTRLDVLVNNAGVMPGERERSKDGHELMFATHVLAPFALTALLADVLAQDPPGRVINVSSGGMYGQSLPGDDLESDRDSYGPKKLYARTKREQVVISEQWGQQLADRGVVVHAMHPGWVDTKGVREWLPVFRALTLPIMRSPEEGADTIVWLGAAPEATESTGQFWHDRRPRPTQYPLGPSSPGEQERQRLWDYCDSLVPMSS